MSSKDTCLDINRGARGRTGCFVMPGAPRAHPHEQNSKTVFDSENLAFPQVLSPCRRSFSPSSMPTLFRLINDGRTPLNSHTLEIAATR